VDGEFTAPAIILNLNAVSNDGRSRGHSGSASPDDSARSNRQLVAAPCHWIYSNQQHRWRFLGNAVPTLSKIEDTQAESFSSAQKFIGSKQPQASIRLVLTKLGQCRISITRSFAIPAMLRRTPNLADRPAVSASFLRA